MESCNYQCLCISNASLKSIQVSCVFGEAAKKYQTRKSEVFCQSQLFNKFEITENFLYQHNIGCTGLQRCVATYVLQSTTVIDH